MMFTKFLLVLLLLFLSIGAFYGGIQFILKPDGSGFGMSEALLQDSLFSDFLVPGIILFFTFGIIPFYVAFALIKKPKNALLSSV